jgi:hypothetical protein
MSGIDEKALEAACRMGCIQGGFDPNEVMANDGPRWRYYVPLATAMIRAFVAAADASSSTARVAALEEALRDAESTFVAIVATEQNPAIQMMAKASLRRARAALAPTAGETE